MTPLSPGESGKYHQSTKRVIRELASCFAGHVEWVNPQTPKKTYKATAGAVLCCCSLCRSTGEVHFKNIFAKGNRALLSTAEEIYGRSLEKDDSPHLLCSPCERRLKSFQEFKLKITATQDSFERVKRCIEVSPSVPRTSSKSAKDSVQRSSRRGLNLFLIKFQSRFISICTVELK